MLFPIINARIHGWLDDLVVLTYVAGAVFFGLHGTAFTIALVGALIHFANARVTNYPQGTLSLISFRTHAFVELAEGVGVLAAAMMLTTDEATSLQRTFLALMGGSQFTAFSFSDYRWPQPFFVPIGNHVATERRPFRSTSTSPRDSNS